MRLAIVSTAIYRQGAEDSAANVPLYHSGLPRYSIRSIKFTSTRKKNRPSPHPGGQIYLLPLCGKLTLNLLMMMMNLIPPGTKYLEGNTLFTSRNLYPCRKGWINIALQLIIFRHEANLTMWFFFSL